MITIEFGKAEKQNLDRNSMFIKFFGNDFQENLEKIKGFWNRIYHKETYEWEVPFSCYNEILQLYDGVNIKYLNKPPKAQKVTDDEILQGLDFNGFNLYDYQLDGVKYGLNHHNFLLLDEQGLGKTLQIISLARYKKEHQDLKHCLIICGINSLKYNWIKEIRKFCKDEDGVILGTKVNKKGKVVPITIEETKKQIDECPEQFFWIINIERMRLTAKDKKEKDSIVHHINNQITKKNLGMIVIDECHRCLDYDTYIKTDIGDLKIGDIVTNKINCNVLTMNEENKCLELKPIVGWYENNTLLNKCLKISTENNYIICTDNHKVFTINKGWIKASELCIGDEVVEFG